MKTLEEVINYYNTINNIDVLEESKKVDENIRRLRHYSSSTSVTLYSDGIIPYLLNVCSSYSNILLRKGNKLDNKEERLNVKGLCINSSFRDRYYPILKLGDLLYGDMDGFLLYILDYLSLSIYGMSIVDKVMDIVNDSSRMTSFIEKLRFEIGNFITSHPEVYIYRVIPTIKEKIEVSEIKEFKICNNPLFTIYQRYKIKTKDGKKKYIYTYNKINLNTYIIAFSESQLKEQILLLKKLKMRELNERIAKTEKTIDYFSSKLDNSKKKLSELLDELFIEEERLNYIFDI